MPNTRIAPFSLSLAVIGVLMAAAILPMSVEAHGATTSAASVDPADLPAAFRPVSERPLLVEEGVQAFALHGSLLAWASLNADAIDILVSDLQSGSERLVASIPRGIEGFHLGSLDFDGRWVVWSDDRFGNLEVFSVDIESGALRRLSQGQSADDHVRVDNGKAVWARLTSIVAADLASGRAWTVHEQAGTTPDPDIGGDVVVWAQATGRGMERKILAKPLEAGNATALAEQPGAVYRLPRIAGDHVVWLAKLQGAPGQVTRTLGELAEIHSTGDAAAPFAVSSSRELMTANVITYPPALGGSRVAWSEQPGAKQRFVVSDLEGDVVFRAVGVIPSYELSPSHLVVVNGDALMFAEWGDLPKEGGGGLPGVAAPTFLAAVAVGLMWRRRAA